MITTSEIFTHLFSETVQAISGDDDRLLQMAIDAAIAEAKGYLHRYDVQAIFNAEDDSRNPLLVYWIKDIAVWHYINIANPGVDYQVRERRYNAAIAWLKGVQRGDIVPDLPTFENVNTSVWLIGSNPRRTQHI